MGGRKMWRDGLIRTALPAALAIALLAISARNAVAAGSFRSAGELPAGFLIKSMTPLRTGDVLIIGPHAAHLYDPSNGALTQTGDLPFWGGGDHAIALGSGTVLIICDRGCLDATRTREANGATAPYDTSKREFRPAASVATAGFGYTATC